MFRILPFFWFAEFADIELGYPFLPLDENSLRRTFRSTFSHSTYIFRPEALSQSYFATPRHQDRNNHSDCQNNDNNDGDHLGIDLTLRPSEDSRLVFNRYGDSYFLEEIWSAGQDGLLVLREESLGDPPSDDAAAG